MTGTAGGLRGLGCVRVRPRILRCRDDNGQGSDYPPKVRIRQERRSQAPRFDHEGEPRAELREHAVKSWSNRGKANDETFENAVVDEARPPELDQLTSR